MKKTIAFIITLMIVSSVNAQEIILEQFAQGLTSPVSIAHAGDSRLFIVQKPGQIVILNADSTINPTPFLDISATVKNTGEKGLLGLAFHPNYAVNGMFFIYYSDTSNKNILARYVVSNDSNVANTTGEILLTFNAPTNNHNGGCLQFGPDGYLYVSIGDGGSTNNNGQDTSILLGKLLRIDVDSSSSYKIPVDNPYVGTAGKDEIWALGLRNPWKFSFDKLTGDIWIADVGQSKFEEINHLPSDSAGANFGWYCYEANIPYNATGCGDATNMVFPAAIYAHENSRASITGGYVYRGNSYPVWQGKYFFADYVSKEIGWVDSNYNITFITPNTGSSFVTFGQDYLDELYIASLNGIIYKITLDEEEPPIRISDIKKPKFTVYPNPTNGSIQIESNAVIDDITLYNTAGKIIKKFNTQNNTLNISTLAKGVYMLTITSGNTISTKKIIVP